FRPYSPLYSPTRWRNWWGFGNGAICDIGTHMFDVLQWVFDIGFPDTVEAEVSKASEFTIPQWVNLYWKFPAKGDRGPINVHWKNGWKKGKQNFPKRIPHIPKETIEQTRNGMAFSGPEGTLFIPEMRATRRPQIFPQSRESEFLASRPKKVYPRLKGGHFKDFFNAIREGRKAGADFAYGAALTEQVLLGALAQRTLKPIRWDPARMRAIDVPEADPFIRPERNQYAWKP
ncbi:hypothetical protein MLD52_23010, partial [Puniceicoccaceae bacterium K14]|nr:hypothetical protein [Puniceicoccaceae bacterium K14]